MAYNHRGQKSANPNQHQPASHTSSTDSHVSQTSQAHTQGQSPLDWTNFMNFPTPPSVSTNNNGASMGRHGSFGGQPFAAATNMSPGMTYSQYQRPTPASQPPYHPSPMQLQPQLHIPGQQPQLERDDGAQNAEKAGGKGKSPSTQAPQQIPAPDGLSLDPDAFSRNIRFQVPPFLSNQIAGAPTFPPGGEAWSGFSGASSLYGDNSQLTPGALFNSLFAQPDPSNDQSSISGADAWEHWADQNKVTSPAPTMLYVNPNPSAARTQRNASQTQAQSTQKTPKMLAPVSPEPNPTMPTSALLPQPYSHFDPNISSIPSMSAPQSSASTINIASSSTQPYAPPSNTQALLQGPSIPPSMIGPNLSDGPGLYSTTGFDMIGVLARVHARKEPKTVLGPVDLSCSFVVVDVRRFDSPIVYASPTFSALTGYDLPQILGRNCRFLQSPEGDVAKGCKRKYTDNVAVGHLKRMLNAGKECQASLINYRRGGIPFINLVTVVPITWDSTDIVYHVGFQVDLVEQPNAILRNMRDGTYSVNYTVSHPPQQALRPPGRDISASGLSNDVLEVMGPRINAAGFGQGEDGGKMEWLKMVLEGADDFVHVLSLKGLFQYVSPSVRRVLEYEPEDLLNKNISDICHPSDIVPLMRELKDSTHAPLDGQNPRMVNLVFRIRRKNSGYVWIECSGRLHVEPGKGRKAVILSGRARHVPTLAWDSVAKNGGLGEKEFWVKVSYQGLILHATSAVSDLLGQPAEEVVGQSIFSLVPGGDNGEPSNTMTAQDSTSPVASIATALRCAISGETQHGAYALRHQMVQKTGAMVEVVSVFYAPRQRGDILPDADEVSVEDSPAALTSASASGVEPVTLVVQVKLVCAGQPATAPLPQQTNSRPVVHVASANVFEELETTRGTSWQYELHQLRLVNRRLKEDIAAARARGAGTGLRKHKKRKADAMGPPPVPESLTAAPRHQLAPGFGLVAPSALPYY
nr:white collar 1 protein [Naematelia aurantialba]